jgi:hypothetical protein
MSIDVTETVNMFSTFKELMGHGEPGVLKTEVGLSPNE